MHRLASKKAYSLISLNDNFCPSKHSISLCIVLLVLLFLFTPNAQEQYIQGNNAPKPFTSNITIPLSLAPTLRYNIGAPSNT